MIDGPFPEYSSLNLHIQKLKADVVEEMVASRKSRQLAHPVAHSGLAMSYG
jgi:hypothetical protein